MSDGKISWGWLILAFALGFILCALIVPAPSKMCKAAFSRAHSGTDSIAVVRESDSYCSVVPEGK